jgi:hypothetical protein
VSSSGRARGAVPPVRSSASDERRRLRLAAWIYGITTAIFFLTMAPQRLAGHTEFNHFALQAEAWTRGRLDLGGRPPAYTGHNDFASYGTKWFVSFPPFPAVLIAPVVKTMGSAAAVRDGLFFLMFAGLAPAVLFLALEKLSRTGRSKTTLRENVALAMLFALGTVYWFSAVQGTVWFVAHVVAAGLTAIYILASLNADQPAVAGLALGLAFATRTPLGFAAPLFLYEAWRASRRGEARLAPTLAWFAAPAAAVLALVFWHNLARFEDPFEFGHRLLVIGWRARIEKWGLFSYHYLGRNLAVVLTSLPYTEVRGAPFQINVHGLALWITSPFYVWALLPRRRRGLYGALALTAALVALPNLLYQNSGWIQFGYRFSNDFAPFLFLMIALSGRRLGAAFWSLGALAVAVNAFGALTFQRTGFERYYYLDRTQRILHQPD